MVGLFINTLPLRIQVIPEDFPVPWLQGLQARQLEVREYEYSPMQEIQNWSELPHGVALFDSIVVFENFPTAFAGEPGPNEHDIPYFERTNYPLCLVVVPNSDLQLCFYYQQHRFSAVAIEQMAEHLRTLLEGVAANPDRRLSELPLLTEAERNQLLNKWNATTTDYPREESIVSLFEAQVACNPEATALVCEEARITYAELNSRSNSLAGHLQALGVGPEVLVGICIDRSCDFVIALLATFKARGAYLPLDPSYPKERLAFMLKEAGVSVLLTLSRFLPELPVEGQKVFCLDADCELLGQYADTNLATRCSPQQLAYVIYTSGSTGRPKGVAIEHRQVLNRLYWMWEQYPFGPDEVGCQKTAANFVDSIWELFGPLLKGIPTVIIRDEVFRDANRLVEELARHQVTRIWVVPLLLRALLDLYPDLQERLPHLRFWVSSGEILTPELFQHFRARMPSAVLYNLYGTSEVWDVTWFDPTRETVADGQTPIGRPIFNVQVYVLDEQMQPVPIGVPGELYVGGHGLARGYHNLPQLTAEKFIPNPFGNQATARLYKTGDLVRYRPDGNIEFLGRLDRQVKIRGFRIEPREVESVLLQHPSVRQAVVVAREDNPGGPFLVAYVVPDRGQVFTPDGLRSFLLEQLPEYMVPPAFVMVDQLPLTPNGKLDWRRLPEARPEARQVYVAARTETEVVIAEMLAELLGVDRVGVHDNFFELGGHSLLAIQLLSRMREAFHVELPVRVVFDGPTVAGLAEWVQGALARGEKDEIPGVVRLSRDAHTANVLPGGKLDSADLTKALHFESRG
jgi:amino acid adenylation domain-containing protein